MIKKIRVNIERISNDATIPSYQHHDDSGADIYAAAGCIIEPGEVYIVPTGLKTEVPCGYELQVRPRSGIALKYRIGILNSPGTIDSGYRGEIKVILINLGNKKFVIKKGDRIAQLVLAPVVRADFREIKGLSKSRRGKRGFGSTGI